MNSKERVLLVVSDYRKFLKNLGHLKVNENTTFFVDNLFQNHVIADAESFNNLAGPRSSIKLKYFGLASLSFLTSQKNSNAYLCFPKSCNDFFPSC